MYDTINMYYNILDNPAPSVEKLFEHCNNKSEHYNVKNDSSYAQGDLKNMKVTLNEASISVKGSLCKYFYGNNIDTLNLTNTREALNQISADLSIDIHKASVSRIDFSTNIVTDFTPTIYYPYLGQLSRFERYEQPNSIYYNQQAKRLLFYDKIEEAKNKGMTIPKQHIGDNLLRYELVLNKGISRYLKYNGLYALDLGSEELFKKLLHLWYSYYQQIQKHSKKLNPMEDKIINPSTFKNEMYNALVRKNPDEFYKMVAELKAKKKFKHPEYYSRINAEIRKIQKTQVVDNELMDELNKKIEGIYLELI
tara:strand:+ start:528 stop:1454 length:927 start_codon:yes stop_codon:yes gene_type:complete